jgi:hypothetical protein
MELLRGYYKPPFKVRVYHRDIFKYAVSKKIALYLIISTFLHEYMHLIQFFVIARGDKKYYKTKRYRKLCEHQAYYLNHIIAKIMFLDYDYHKHLKSAWDEINYEDSRHYYD